MESAGETKSFDHPSLDEARDRQDRHDFDVQTLISWSAPGRPFTKKGRQFYLSVFLLLFFFEVILFLFGQYELMLVLVALTFLSLVFHNPYNHSPEKMPVRTRVLFPEPLRDITD